MAPGQNISPINIQYNFLSREECAYLKDLLKNINVRQIEFPLKIYSLPKTFLLFFRRKKLLMVIDNQEQADQYLEMITKRLNLLNISHEVNEKVRRMPLDKIYRHAFDPFPKLKRQGKK